MSHTPTPWQLYQGEEGPIAVVTGEPQPGQRKVIARVDMPYVTLPPAEQAANAAFIVQAVNSHEELIDALIAVTEELDPDEYSSLLKIVRQVLTKAKGQP